MQQVSLVTGASQGVGKGIVEGLAEAGQRVYFTGRDSARLDQVVKEAAALGGECFGRNVDHNDDTAVNDLVDEIIRNHTIKLLVNNVWGGYERMMENGKFTFIDPFWEQPLWRWDAMMNIGVRAAFVITQKVVRHMLENGEGLIINISFWAAQKYTGNTIYGIAKAATDKMSSDMARELRDKGVQVISLYPGLVRTEKVMANAAYMDLSNSESPRFIGRTIAALMNDKTLREAYNGKVAVAADLARQMGVTDIDGKSPEPLTLEKL